MSTTLGIDVGGSGIKGALVDVDTGVLTTDRVRMRTPNPATPAAVAAAVAEVAATTGWSGARFGCTLPAVVVEGIVHTAANIDSSWIDIDGCALLEAAVGAPVVLLNDADAAGLAETRFGAGRDEPGVVLLLTFGTGIGSSVFTSGALVPNTELGHMVIDGIEAEATTSAKVQEDEALTFGEWSTRVNRFLAAAEAILWPDLIIFGGGISKEFSQYRDLLESRARIVPATFRNEAGIIGAALATQEAT